MKKKAKKWASTFKRSTAKRRSPRPAKKLAGLRVGRHLVKIKGGKPRAMSRRPKRRSVKPAATFKRVELASSTPPTSPAIGADIPIGPVQSTRMLKIVCGKCEWTARTSQKHIDAGLPTCHCGGKIKPVASPAPRDVPGQMKFPV